MLTAESLVGKIVIFIVEKTVGKLVALPFDKKRKACRALTKLYYCIQCLDDVTASFLRSLDSFRESGNAFAVMNSLNNHSYEIELATNMFVDLGHELNGGLELIDPVLAQCCHALYISKGDFLTFMSNSIHWDRSVSPAKIIVKIPQGGMESVNMESMYQQTVDAFRAGKKNYWPCSTFDDFREDFQDISIGWESEEAAAQLREMVLLQNETLKKAKEGLRTLIMNNFSIEEVLFQTDSHPYR